MYTLYATYNGNRNGMDAARKEYGDGELGIAWKAFKDAVLDSASLLREGIKDNGMDRLLGEECEYVAITFSADGEEVATFRRYRDGAKAFDPFTEKGLEFQQEVEGRDVRYLLDRVLGDVMSRYELHFTLDNTVQGDDRERVDCLGYFPSVRAAEVEADRLLMKVRDYDGYRRTFEIRDTVDGTIPMKLTCLPGEIKPESCAYDSNILIDGNIPTHNGTIEKLRTQAWNVCCSLRAAVATDKDGRACALGIAEEFVACLRIVQHGFEDFGTEDIIVGCLIDAVHAVIDWVREHE